MGPGFVSFGMPWRSFLRLISLMPFWRHSGNVHKGFTSAPEWCMGSLAAPKQCNLACSDQINRRLINDMEIARVGTTIAISWVSPILTELPHVLRTRHQAGQRQRDRIRRPAFRSEE